MMIGSWVLVSFLLSLVCSVGADIMAVQKSNNIRGSATEKATTEAEAFGFDLWYHSARRNLDRVLAMQKIEPSSSQMDTLESAKFPVPRSTPYRYLQFKTYNTDDCTAGAHTAVIIPLDICLRYNIDNAEYAIFRVNKDSTHVGIFEFTDNTCATPASTTSYSHFRVPTGCTDYLKWKVLTSRRSPKAGLVYRFYDSSTCTGAHWTMVSLPVCNAQIGDDDIDPDTQFFDCATDTVSIYTGTTCDASEVFVTYPISSISGYEQCVASDQGYLSLKCATSN